MQTDTPPKEFDSNNDPAKLSRIGSHVTKRLNANPLVQPVDHPDAQLYVYQGFLGAADCKTLIAKIDAEAVPSTSAPGATGSHDRQHCTKGPSKQASGQATAVT